MWYSFPAWAIPLSSFVAVNAFSPLDESPRPNLSRDTACLASLDSEYSPTGSCVQAAYAQTDDWCNMPHVRKETYTTPPKTYELVYVEVIQRHHKRTPYGSNLFYQGDVVWDCDRVGPLYGLRSQTSRGSEASPVQWQSYVDHVNPFAETLKTPIAASNCQFPQLTSEGLEDSIIHGTDLRKVYGSRLQLSDIPDPQECTFRVTNNPITSQVASGILRGFYPHVQNVAEAPVVYIQPDSIDSLEPRYSCSRANSLRDSFTTGINGSLWQDHLREAFGDSTFEALDSVSGIPTNDGGWHVSFDHYFDNLKARQCHSKPLPCNVNNSSLCVSQTLANKVYDIGNWEYSYLYRDAPGALSYSALKFGAWMLELEARLKAVIAGTSKTKYTHNIAHDGSISALLGFLQISKMRWPGMGSEVVFELYRRRASGSVQWSVRVLWSGDPMQTSTSLGVLDMVEIEDFLTYIHALVPNGQWLREACQ